MSTTAAPQEDLSARFGPLLARIAARTLEQEHARALPYEEVRALADAGFGALRLPVEEGGAGASISEFLALLVQRGRRPRHPHE